MDIFLSIIIFVASLCVIISILLQETNSSGLSSTIGGAKETLFGKTRTRGLQATLQRMTVISSSLFFLAILIFNIFLKTSNIFE
ncbi:MAG: preprotein translocase subunit SecG [Eubacteriaceae bacterium]|nr:preprotein translocase subunit SecG [Eubacteriaceae bacterium]